MAITKGNETSDVGLNEATPYGIAHTVHASADYLAVRFANRDDSLAEDIDWDPDSGAAEDLSEVTGIVNTGGSPDHNAGIWGLAAPSTGAGDVLWNGDDDVVLIITDLIGVDQMTPAGTPQTNTTAGSNPTSTIDLTDAEAGDMCLDALCSRGSRTASVGSANQTEDYNDNTLSTDTSERGCFSSKTTFTTDKQMSWDLAGGFTEVAHCGVAFKAAGESAAVGAGLTRSHTLHRRSLVG